MRPAPTPRRRANVSAIVLIAAAVSSPAYTQIETPTLSTAWPNRADVGDTVTLVGTGLAQDGTTITAAFATGLACPITRRTSTAVDITVPTGAKDGYVSVTVRGQSPDGTPTSVTSNGVPLLVIWTFFETSGLNTYTPRGVITPDSTVIPGVGDFVDLAIWGADVGWNPVEAGWRVGHDRSSRVLYVASGLSPYLCGPSLTAVNPLSGEVVAVVRWGNSPIRSLVSLPTYAVLAQFPSDPNGTTLTPLAVRFDASGVLYVAALDEQGLVFVFRFDGRTPVSLDPAGPASMVPGGVEVQGPGFWGPGEMAVGGTGVVYVIRDPLVPGGQTAQVLRVPGSTGASYDLIPLPDMHYADGTLWHLAANCRGEGFAAASSWGSESHYTVTLYGLTDGSLVTTLGGVGWFLGLGTDGYDDLFVHGMVAVNGTWRWGFRRMTVADLPVGFYGAPPPGVTAAPAAAPAFLAPPSDPPPIPKEWLVRRRPESTPLQQRTEPDTARHDTSSPAAKAEIAAATMATSSPHIREFHAAATAAVAPVVSPAELCDDGGRLVVQIDEKPYPDGTKATIPLGKELELAALWQKGKDSFTPVEAQWRLLLDAKPDWEQEHAAAAAAGLVEDQAGSESAVLFPDKVLLLFDEGSQAASVPVRTIWPIHNGSVTLKVHADQTPGGGPADVQVQITVTYDNVRLGQAPNAYDPMILQWANAFGFPPQYIEGLIKRESRFNRVDYRYEPRAWDFGEEGRTQKEGVQGMLTDDYFAPVRFEEPGGIAATGGTPLSRGTYLSQIDIDGRTGGPTLYTLPGGGGWRLAECQMVSAGAGALSAWSLYLGSNGYSGDPPDNLAPCGQRMNWEPRADIYRWDQERPMSKQDARYEATFWFYQNQNYIAQTLAAASYGLMQVSYSANLKSMNWFVRQPQKRGYQPIVAPNTNIYLGTRWLVWPAGQLSRKLLDTLFESSSHSEGGFQSLVGEFLCGYNGGASIQLPAPSCEYARAIGANARDFGPDWGTQ